MRDRSATVPRAIAVLGAGSGGLALAGVLASRGYEVRLWNRDATRLQPLQKSGFIVLSGCISAEVRLKLSTTDLAQAVCGANVILIVTTADAHEEIAVKLAPFLAAGQCLLLCPGRTGGAFLVQTVLTRFGCPSSVLVAEAQSLVYACRGEGATVNLIGVKAVVPVSGITPEQTDATLSRVLPLFDCFVAGTSSLQTSLENIGAIFHPAIVLFNAAAIERGETFYLYRDMTPRLAEFLLALDRERLAIGAAYKLELCCISDWITRTYPSTEGKNLRERLQNCPAYRDIFAPTKLDSRLLTEDLPTGLVPMAALGEAAGVSTPLMNILIDLGNALLRRDFRVEGRTLERLGLAGMGVDQIIERLS